MKLFDAFMTECKKIEKILKKNENYLELFWQLMGIGINGNLAPL